MVTPSMPGAPWLDLTRFHARARLSLASTASSKLSVFPSSCLEARFASAAGTPSPVGAGGAFEVVTGCSSCLVVRPFGRPTPGGLLWRLLTSAPSRRAARPAATPGVTVQKSAEVVVGRQVSGG